jgi:hypothetical protein
LAVDIKREISTAVGLARTCLEHARRAGELLLTAKGLAGFGNFEKWVKKNCHISKRTAEDYMKIAGGWAELQSKTQNAADLSIREALKLLRKPSGKSGDIVMQRKVPAIEVTPDGRMDVLPMPNAMKVSPAWVADTSPCPADELLDQVASVQAVLVEVAPESVASWRNEIKADVVRRLEGLRSRIDEALAVLKAVQRKG